MKKFLFAFFMTLVTQSSYALFGGNFHMKETDGCAQVRRMFNKDDYYFCGSHTFTCDGDPVEDSEIENGFVHWYNSGESESIKGNLYWCCNGEITDKRQLNTISKKDKVAGTPGQWVKGSTWIKDGTREIKTKAVSGGTCTYVEETDICGHLHSTEENCDDPQKAKQMVTCPDGQYYRESSGKCATYCDSGFAYESPLINTCIACSETATQGIVSDEYAANVSQENIYYVAPGHRMCRKCAATSFFDSRTRTCVSKSDLQGLSTVDLQYGKNGSKQGKVSDQCWTKYGVEYKNCVLSTVRSVTQKSSSTNTSTSSGTGLSVGSGSNNDKNPTQDWNGHTGGAGGKGGGGSSLQVAVDVLEP